MKKEIKPAPLPKGVEIAEKKIVLCQEEDCCGRPNKTHQYLTVETADGGGGVYPVITTERWAFDTEDLETWAAWLREFCA